MKRIFILAIGAMLALGLTAGPALAGKGGNGGPAEISVAFSCTSVDVSSSQEISNVVLQFADGTTQRFQDGYGENESFAGTGENAGKTIEVVWVKSGDNQSGDGPGYGEKFESDADCSQTSDESDESDDDSDESDDDSDESDDNSDESNESDDDSNESDDDSNESDDDSNESDDDSNESDDDSNESDDDSGDDSDESDETPAVEGDETEGDNDETSNPEAPSLDLQSDDTAVLGESFTRSGAVLGAQSAETLPVTGAPFESYLLVALTSIAFGAALLRRSKLGTETI